MFGGVKKIELAIFSKHLSVMLKSGVNVVDALETLESQTESAVFKNILMKCVEDMKGGVSLSDSFAKYPKVFDQFYQNVVGVGEESGTLSESLAYLELKLEKEVTLGKKINEALFYPKVVLSLATIVAFAVSIFVLPQLGNMFLSFDVSLPLATRILLKFSTFMQADGLYLFFGLVALFVFGWLFMLWKPVRNLWAKFTMSLPIVGPFIIEREVAAFCRNLGIMLNSGIPISRALKISADATENPVFAEYIRRLKAGLDEGKTLGSTLQSGKFKKIPIMVTKMVTVGEKSGSLNQMLLYLADNYEASTDEQAKGLSAMIEPILLTIIAAAVLLIALAVIMPIYQLSDVLK
ncbi:MAG: type II secretion system F family protein [Candidatus Berkelbacteria bacterium]|nr:type II secretion system F family protein [Candidatus Berkelbacteria bacterium]